MVATGKPVVLVLVNGRPASQHVPAILEAWYPGTQGGSAVARLLLGDVVPGGKLPFSWPRDVGQIPINYAHNTTQAPQDQGKRYWDVESTPLYPFGFGLSYSQFTFSDLRLSKAKIQSEESLEVTVVVENTGSVTADEVAQLYLHQQYGSASRPVRELKGFQRIELKPAERKTLRFELSKDERTYWSAAGERGLASGSKPILPRPLCAPAPQEDRGKSADRRLQRKSILGDCHSASRSAADWIPPCGPNASWAQTYHEPKSRKIGIVFDALFPKKLCFPKVPVTTDY